MADEGTSAKERAQRAAQDLTGPRGEWLPEFRGGIPWGGYWKRAGQVFQYPMVTVFAATKAEADEIAGPEHRVMTYDQVAYCEAMLDSAEASSRLGIWGRPDLAAVMMRGDSASLVLDSSQAIP
jgi:hypothetical protein